jgi:hypothetical protein
MTVPGSFGAARGNVGAMLQKTLRVRPRGLTV